MFTFSILKKPHDEMRPPKIIEVQLCLSEYVSADDGSPALTHLCATEEEVEVQFERVFSALKRKKSEALAILKESTQLTGTSPHKI